jgi:hypothetical protein
MSSAPSPACAGERRTARDRWIRTIKTVIARCSSRPKSTPRILDRVAGVQAEVRRRLRASNGNAPEAMTTAATSRTASVTTYSPTPAAESR